MPVIELDHLFILCRDPAGDRACSLQDQTKEIASYCSDQLTGSGFVEGGSNAHPGQGTANRRFFFNGFMLEFLYVVDDVQLSTELTASLALADRFAHLDASLFGVGSRSAGAVDSDASYSYLRYQPLYLKAPMHIQVAKDTGVDQPLWFHLPFVHNDQSRGVTDSALENNHLNGVSKLTALTLKTHVQPSVSSQVIADELGVNIKTGSEQIAHLEFDHARQGQQVDELLPFGLQIVF